MNRHRFVWSTGVIVLFGLAGVWHAPQVSCAQTSEAEAPDPALGDYLAGNGLLNRGLYDLAAVEYRRFLSEHADHDRASVARYGLSVCLFRIKSHEEAIVQLRALSKVEDFEYAAEVATMLGQSHLALKQYLPAAEAFQECAREFAQHSLADEAAAGAAEALYLAGKYDEAAGWAHLMATRWADSPLRVRAEFFGGLSEMARKGYAEAAKLFDSVLDRNQDGPFSDQAALLLAQCHERSDGLADAIRQYHKLLKRKKTKYAPEALFALGALHHQRGELKEAGIALDTLLDRFGESKVVPQGNLLRGRVAFEQEDYDAAHSFFKAAGEADAALRDRAAYWMAKCDLRRERYDRASTRLTDAVEAFPESELIAEIWYDLAIAQLRQEAFGPAIDALNTFRKRFGEHALAPDALHLLAMTEHQRRGFDESLRYCSEFLATYPLHRAVAGVAFLAAENDFLAGRYDQAVNGYKQYLSRYGDDVQASQAKLRLGTALHRLERYDEAEPFLADATGDANDAPVFGSRHLTLGDIHFRRGEWKLAEAQLRSYLSAGLDQPGADDALIKLGLSLQRQDRPKEAGVVYDQLLDRFPESPHRLQALFEKGQTLVMLNEPAEAEDVFKKVLEAGADSRFAAHALNHLATLAMRKGDFDTADALYGRASGSASDEGLKAGASYQQIKALMASKKFAEAERAIRAYLSGYPADENVPAAKAELAIALARQNKWAEAVGAVDEAVSSGASLEPALFSAAQYEKAWCLRELGRTEEAAAEYRTLIDRGVTREYELHALLELAGIEIDAKRFKQAATFLRRIHESVDAGDVPPSIMGQATYRLGVCAFELKQHADAVALFEEFLAGYPHSELVASAAFYAGESAFTVGQFERAVKHLTRVTEEFSSDAVAGPGMLRLGEALAQLQRFSASERVFRDYLDKYDDGERWYQAQFGLGWARENQQRYGEAITTYRALIARHQGATTARAQFQIGECLFAEQKYEEAAGELLKVDILYDYPEWSAAALFEAGRCFAKLNKVAEARDQFQRVVDKHKDSRWAQMAAQQLSVLVDASVPGR